MGLLRPVWRMTDTSSSSSSGGGGGRGGTGVPQNHWRRVSTLPEARGFPAAVYAAAVPQPHHQQQKEWEEGGSADDMVGTLFVIGGYDAPTKNDSALVQALDLRRRSLLAWSNCSS
jgi:hypothetical protein